MHAPNRKQRGFWDCALGLLFLGSITVPSIAEELVSQDSARTLWQLPATGQPDFVAVTAIEFSPNSESIAFGTSDGAVRILRIAQGSLPRLITQGDYAVEKVAFSPDGNLLASAPQVNLSAVGHADQGQKNEHLPSPKGSQCVAFSPDGQLLAVGNYVGKASVIDLSRGETRFTMDPFAGTGPIDTALYKPSTIAMDFSPDGKLLAVTTDFFDDELPSFSHLQVWDTKTGKLRFFFRGVGYGFSPEGDLLAYRSQHFNYDHDGRIVLLDIDTFLPAAVLTDRFADARFSPVGRSMAVISHNRRQVEIWAIALENERPTGISKRTRVLKHAASVTSFAFAPDGHSLVTGDAEGTIRLWNLGK